ncbi:hypothetical protein U1Q18_019659 [Sarracenia purpurea var. burkii]
MICSCMCTGGSASTLEFSKQRASTASCKSCGGKPLVDGQRSPSTSMLSTVGLERTSLINSNLTWSKVSKGSRSSSRRARKSFELGFETSEKLVKKDFKDVEMPVSESEKLGVTLLGCRFNEKAEHVPIKKRRFLFRTPSPPPGTPSPHPEATETFVKKQPASGQGFPQNPTVECQCATSDGASSADLGQIVDNEVNIHGKNLVKVNEQRDEAEDFSGISILAAAACSNSLGYVEEGSGVEESFGRGDSSQELMNTESKDDLMNSADISTEGTGSSISPSPGEECPPSLKTDHSSPKDLALENVKDVTFQVCAAVGSLTSDVDAKIRTQESSARDFRLHWDLNTVMDAWERPFDCQHVDSPANVADGISEYDVGRHGDENKSIGQRSQRAPEGASDDTGKALSSGDLKRLAIEAQDFNIKEDKLHACIDVNRDICSQGKMLSSEIHNSGNVVMDPDKNTESSYNQEKTDPHVRSRSSISAKHAKGPGVSGVFDGNAFSNCVESGTTGNTESFSSHGVASVDSQVDCSLASESAHLTCARLFEEKCNATSTNDVSVTSMENCSGEPQMSPPTIFFSCQTEKKNVTFPNALNDDGIDAQKSSELLGDGNVVKNMACMEPLQIPSVDAKDSAVCESDDRDNSHSYSVAPISGAFLGGQPVAPVDRTMQHGENLVVPDNAETDNQAHIDAEEPAVMPSGKSMALLESHRGLSRSYHDVVHSYGKFAFEEPFEDGYDTDVSQGDRGISVGIEKSPDLQVDYDSQYEDGELRESSLHAWEEYDGDEEEMCVDYGLVSRDTNNLGSENTGESNYLGNCLGTKAADAASSREREVGTSSPCLSVHNLEKVHTHDKESGSEPDLATRDGNSNNRQDNVKEANQSADLKMKISGWDRLPENHRCTSDVSIVRDGIIRKNFNGDQKDGSYAEDTEMKVFRSRVNRRELFSRIERPASRGMFFRRDKMDIRGSSSNEDYSNPRSEREFDTVKSFGRGRYSLYRGRGGGHWADSSGSERGLKRHRSPIYRGLDSFHRFGPEDVSADCTIIKEGGAGSSNQTGRQDTNAYSRGPHRSLRRSGSPAVGREMYDMRWGIRAPEDMSPDRFLTVGRGRSVRYGPRVYSGGPRGRYSGPVTDDCIESSLNYSHSLNRRRRSFSPTEKRGNPPARRSSSKSPSRSRFRSPNAWQSPRVRDGVGVAGNLGFRRQSRSPNFRSGPRMPRVRSPHMRPDFLPNHEMGFMSASRTRDSPPPNSRWSGYKRRSSFLDGRSPGRIGGRGERFDMLDSVRKPKPNEYYRSVHPGRFSELNGVGRGGPTYEGADDDRGKHGYNRYRLVRPMKHYDFDGAVKRFRYDDEDGFVAGHETRDKEATDYHGRPKAFNRGIDNQTGDDAPRRSREERGPFLFRQDRKYNTKSFAMRECDEDVGPRRRPS